MEDWKLVNRRDFIKYTFGTAAALGGLPLLGSNNFYNKKEVEVLSILYTNDQHSRIEPFPENDAKYPGEGGFSKRAALIEKIRNEGNHVLLLDAGDVFQGTPYFNYFQGELEYKLMSLMQYDATTFGNHDFDLGIENLIKQMPHAKFDFLNCNYNFEDTDLKKHEKIKPYKVFKRGDLKIGVLGVGIDLDGLIAPKNRQGLVYENTIEHANKISEILKHQKKCDFVICLSHLGYKYSTDKISDIQFANKSKNIDLIIGGHTHTFLQEPDFTVNAEGKKVQITQVGWAGIWLGRIDLHFHLGKKSLLQNNSICKIY